MGVACGSAATMNEEGTQLFKIADQNCSTG
jgi:hypothetical protein